MARGFLVFDDWRSLLHLVLGLASTLLGVAWIVCPIFFAYEFAEHLVKRDNPVADCLEFLCGCGVGALVLEWLHW